MVNVTGPRRLRRYERRDTVARFRGLNTELDPDVIADEEFTELINFNVTVARTLVKRPGFKVWSNQSGMGSSKILAILDNNTGNQQVVSNFVDYVGGGSQTRASTDGGQTWGTILSATRAFTSAVQYNNYLYLVDTFGVCRWDGTTLTAITGSPPGVHIVAFKDRLWVCDGNTSSNLYYSDPGPGGVETWGASSIIKVRTGDPSMLVASLPFADRLMLFKTMTVWQLFLAGNVASWQLRILNTERGALSENCVVTFQGLIYMLSWDGVWRSDGTIFRELSNRVRKYFKTAPQPYRDPRSALSISNRRLFIAYRGTAYYANASPSKYLWYNLDADAWSEMQVSPSVGLWRPLSVFNWYNPGYMSTLPTTLQLVDSWNVEPTDTKAIYVLDDTVPADKGYAFNSHLKTKIMSFGDNFDMKRCKVFMPELDSTNGAIPSVTYGIDNQLDDVRIRAGSLVLQNPKVYRVDGPGYFRQVDVAIDENTTATMRVLTLNFVVMLKSLTGTDM
jgi:hypothetical protein